MKYVLILILFCLTSCKQSSNVSGFYYPEDHREELSLSSLSIIQASNLSPKSGETIDLLLISKNESGAAVLSGGGVVSFQTKGLGSGTISNLTDLGDGTYSAKFLAIRAGTVDIYAKLNPNKKTLSQSLTLTVIPGDLVLEKSTISLSKKQMLIGEQAEILFYPRDFGRNLIDRNDLVIRGALLDGTSDGSVSSPGYQIGGIYVGYFNATTVGTPTKINLSLLRIGQVLSTATIEVVNNVPNFLTSQITGVSTLKLGQSTILNLKLINSNIATASIALTGWPVSFIAGTGNVASFTLGDVSEAGNGNYRVLLTPTSTGTLNITAKANGDLISQTFSLEVVP